MKIKKAWAIMKIIYIYQKEQWSKDRPLWNSTCHATLSWHDDDSMMQAAVHSNFFYKLQRSIILLLLLLIDNDTFCQLIFIVFWSVESVRAFEMAINIYTDMVWK